MAERVRIGASDSPLRVLDSGGVNNALGSLFDANFKVMRGAVLRGVATSTYIAPTDVYYGKTFARAPHFFLLFNDHLVYNGAQREFQLPYTARAADNTFTRGGSGRAYTNHIQIYAWDNAVGQAGHFYYAILRNMIGS